METLRKGLPCVDDIENLDTSGFPVKAAGEIRRAGKVVKTSREIDRKIYFFDKALEQLESTTAFRERYRADQLLLNIGGGVDYFDIETVLQQKSFSPGAGHHKMASDMRGLARKWGIAAGSHIFASACTASAQAIGLSFRMLKRGLAGAIISGGSDSMISYTNYLGFCSLGTLSSSSDPSPFKCKPCDLESSGTVLSEASVAILMENSGNVPDNVTPLAEITGYGCTMDAMSVTDPDPSGLTAAKAVRAALEEASLSPDDIDCIHLHGTGTIKCAPAEYNCLREVFGPRIDSIPVYSMKGQVGHSIGACTAVEILGVVYSLQNQVVLPTVNFRTPNPAAPFRMVTEVPLEIPVRNILKLNSAFGGHNTALIIRKWEK